MESSSRGCQQGQVEDFGEGWTGDHVSGRHHSLLATRTTVRLDRVREVWWFVIALVLSLEWLRSIEQFSNLAVAALCDARWRETRSSESARSRAAGRAS